MADKHLKTSPHHLRGHEDCWWYEEPGGICIVVEAYNGRGEVQTKQRTIPWTAIRNALARKDQ